MSKLDLSVLNLDDVLLGSQTASEREVITRDLLIFASRVTKEFQRYSFFLIQNGGNSEFLPDNIKNADEGVDYLIEQYQKANSFLGAIEEFTQHSSINNKYEKRFLLVRFQHGAVLVSLEIESDSIVYIWFELAGEKPLKPIKTMIKNLGGFISVPIKITYLDSSGEPDIFERNYRIRIRDLYLLEYAYPYIPNIWDFMYEYLQSEETFLILGGDPGTGKSYFMMTLLALATVVADFKVRITDSELLEKLQKFENLDSNKKVLRAPAFVTPDSLEMVKDLIIRYGVELIALDDGAEILGNRSEFNSRVDAVNTLLSLTGGPLFSNLKIIVTFNKYLELDQAALRTGRTFADVQFRPLTPDEANKFMEVYNRVYGKNYDIKFEKDVVLSEIYGAINGKKMEIRSIERKRVGF